MKKIILKSGMTAVILTAVLCGLNLLKGVITGEILGIEMQGGEYVAWRGLGVLKETFYPLYSIDNPVESSTIFSIDPFSLITTFLVVYVIVFVVWTIIATVHNKRESDAA